MFYRVNPTHPDHLPMTNAPLAPQPLLKPACFLRYDDAHQRPHGVPQMDVELTAAGEAEMDTTGPGFPGGGNPPRQAEPLPHQGANDGGSARCIRQDSEECSEAAPELDQVPDDPHVRAERLARIRAEIAAGTYETPEKLERAVERLMQELR